MFDLGSALQPDRAKSSIIYSNIKTSLATHRPIHLIALFEFRLTFPNAEDAAIEPAASVGYKS